MNFLRTLFWVILAVSLLVLANRNWHPVTMNLWGGLRLDAKLPVLLLAAFLLGFLPTLLMHRASRWTLRRRVEGLERQLADAQGIAAAPGPPPALVAEPPYSAAVAPLSAAASPLERP